MSSPAVLELRMRPRWRLFVGLAVPAFACLIVAGSATILSSSRSGVGGLLTVAMLIAVLGGLIVVPGTAVLIRLARGVPDVRIDQQGIVWGRDRARDLAIDWKEVQAVRTKLQKTQYLTDRLFVIEPRAGVTRPGPSTAYGRMMAIGNRLTSRSRYAISTLTADESWDRIKATIERHLGRPVDDGG